MYVGAFFSDSYDAAVLTAWGLDFSKFLASILHRPNFLTKVCSNVVFVFAVFVFR